MSDEIEVRDRDGNIVYPTWILTIAPIDYEDEVKEIAFWHMQNIAQSEDTLDQMMPIRLSSNGLNPATHIFCSRFGYTHELRAEYETLTIKKEELNADWISSVEYTLNDNPEEIKSKFCCFSGVKSEWLSFLGLIEI